MKRLIIPLTIILTAVILAGCFFLPTFVSRFKDSQTIGMLTISNGSGVSYETKSLKIVDRLKMITSAGRILVDKGKNMDANTAYESALGELGKLAEKGVLKIDPQACELGKYSVAVLVDSKDPSKSMIVWELYIKSDSYDINVSVDDETGMLLTLYYNIDEMAYKSGEASIYMPATQFEPRPAESVEQGAGVQTSEDKIGQILADYYGLQYISSEIDNIKYYTRVGYELSDGQTNITLYVTITYLGFMVST